MASSTASSGAFSAPFPLKLRTFQAYAVNPVLDFAYKSRRCGHGRRRPNRFGYCYCQSVSHHVGRSSATGKKAAAECAEDWRFDRNTSRPWFFASPPSRNASKQDKFFPRCTPRNSGLQSRDSPPKRDTGIANEKDWGINLLSESINESGTNEDGSTWFRESGEELGENGYRCRWTRMGGQSSDASSEWKETWWEKSDWTGYKELGVEKSGKNAEGDSWWETWKEALYQDEWSNLARIERSAEKQAKSGTENAGWWEKYDAKGQTEKGANKYGRLNEQSWTDKWAETELGTKWGDKWEEKFFDGIGSRQGETWHVSSVGDRMYTELNAYAFNLLMKVHKYGKSTTGESWDIFVEEETYYEAEPHYGWADVVGDSGQLLSIQPRERPPGVYPNIEYGSPPPPSADEPPTPPSSP
ncbi:hypothetical protein Sjap_009762 [Stephania japonica]|uniref:Uncharacterized protein n=1 Tax=Stephania japonica TaxID=461633 RepID=A0AAP0J961_9MAGN